MVGREFGPIALKKQQQRSKYTGCPCFDTVYSSTLSVLCSIFIGLVGWLVGFLTSSSTTRLYRGRAPRQERLTILRAATHETELGDHGFCFSRSHYTDTDPTSRERAATAGIELVSSSPGVTRSTAELPRPPPPPIFIGDIK